MKRSMKKPNRYALFHQMLKQMDPGWVEEHRFAPPRRWRFDFAHPGRKLAIEVQGGIWTRGRHSRGGQNQLKEMEKLNAAALDGWLILYFSPQQVHSGAALRVVRMFGAGKV
jgi:hypothetical protein